MLEFQIEQLKIETLELETRQAERKFQALKREASKARYDRDDLDEDSRDVWREPSFRTIRTTRIPSFRPASPKGVTISQSSEKRKASELNKPQNGTTYIKPVVKITTAKDQLTKSSSSHGISIEERLHAPDYPMVGDSRNNERKFPASLVTGNIAADGDNLPLDWSKLGSFLSRIADAQEVLARPQAEKSMPSLVKTAVSEGPSRTQSQSRATTSQDSHLLTKATNPMANNIGKAETEGVLPTSAALHVPRRTLRKSPKSRTISEESPKEYIKEGKAAVKEKSQDDTQPKHRRGVVSGASAIPSDPTMTIGNPGQAELKITSVERSLVPYRPWLLRSPGKTPLYAKREPSPPPTPYGLSHIELPRVHGPGPRHPHATDGSDESSESSKSSESLPQSRSRSSKSDAGSQNLVGNNYKIPSIPQVPQPARKPHPFQPVTDSVKHASPQPKEEPYTHIDNDENLRPRYEAYEYIWPDNISEEKFTRGTAVESWIPVPQEELIRRVEETNTRSMTVPDQAEGMGTLRKLLNKIQNREQGPMSVLEQYESMEPFRKAHVLKLLERKNKDENDSNFQWLLASIKFEKQPNDRRSRPDIKSIQIIIKRTVQSALPGEPTSCLGNMTGLRDSLKHGQPCNENINAALAQNAVNRRPDKAAVRIDENEWHNPGQKPRRSIASSDEPRKQDINNPRLSRGQMSPVMASPLQKPAHVQDHPSPSKSQDPRNLSLPPPNPRVANSATNTSMFTIFTDPDEPAVRFEEPKKTREINLTERPPKPRNKDAFKDSHYDHINIDPDSRANATQPVPTIKTSQVDQISGTFQPAPIPTAFSQSQAKPSITSHPTSLRPNATTLPDFSNPEARHPIASQPMPSYFQDYIGRVNDLRYAGRYNMRAGPHSRQNILRTSEAWLLRRAEPDSQNAPRTWERVTRILLPMSTEALNDTVQLQARSKSSLWKTFSSLSTFQQRQIDALFEAKWVGELDNRLDWVLASLSVRPKRAKALGITSIQVILKRSLQEGVPLNSMFPSPPPPVMHHQPLPIPFRSDTRQDAHRPTGRSTLYTGRSTTDSANVKSDQQSSSRRARVYRRRALSPVDDYEGSDSSDNHKFSDWNRNTRQVDLGPRTSLIDPIMRRHPNPADLRIASKNRKSSIWEGDMDDYAVIPAGGPSKSRDTRSLGVLSARHLEQDLQETENQRLAIEKELSRRYGYNPRRDNMKGKGPQQGMTELGLHPSSASRREEHDNWPFKGEEYPGTRPGNQGDRAVGSSGLSEDLQALSGLYYGPKGGPLRNAQVPPYTFTLPKPNPIVDNILSKWTTVSADIQQPQQPVDDADPTSSTPQKDYISGGNPKSSQYVPSSTQNKDDDVIQVSGVEEKLFNNVRLGKD